MLHYSLDPMSIDFYQFKLPTKIIFQAGIALDFSLELENLGLKKVMIVTDAFLKDNGVIDSIQEGIASAGVEVAALFSEVPPNSEIKIVKACAELASRSGAEAMIAIGGGSVLDTAKAANILFSLGGDLVEDYSGAQTITEDLKPLIVIPTTSGTGSEVTMAAVILDEENDTKLSFVDDHMKPTLALLDPELTLSKPAKLTAATGMDALTHAIEAISSVQKNPMSDALAKEAISLIFKNILKAVQEPSNLDARSAMMAASNMAGIAFDHAMVGVVHAMSHATGGIAHVPHGLANSILLPYGMEYNFEESYQHYAEIAPLLGLQESDEESAAKFVITQLKNLRSDLKKACGLPDSLSEAGVQESQLESIAEAALADGASFYNPKELEFEGILAQLRKAF